MYGLAARVGVHTDSFAAYGRSGKAHLNGHLRRSRICRKLLVCYLSRLLGRILLLLPSTPDKHQQDAG
jgi:hypothetical protein